MRKEISFNNVNEFLTFVEANKVKFTKPQKEIITRLKRGYKIIVVNAHRMSGGEMMWTSDEGNRLEYAGKVYKAFFNVFNQVEKQTNISFSHSFAMSKTKGITY